MNKKTIISVMVVAMLVTVSLYFVGGTYARYASEYTGTAKTDVAAWAVKLNDKSGTSASQTLDVTFEVQDNEFVVPGKIAPDVTAVGNLKVDLTDTEVAVDLVVDKGEGFDEAIEALGLEAGDITATVAVKSGDESKVTSGSGKKAEPYVINLQNQKAFTADNGVINFEVKIEWTNSDEHNSKDTTAGIAHQSLSLPITIKVQQHIAEA